MWNVLWRIFVSSGVKGKGQEDLGGLDNGVFLGDDRDRGVELERPAIHQCDLGNLNVANGGGGVEGDVDGEELPRIVATTGEFKRSRLGVRVDNRQLPLQHTLSLVEAVISVNC